jgi:tetratricopeptide (TPR) repeat protein
MKKVTLGFLACFALPCGAMASAYSDFNAGVAARTDRDYDGAIRLMSKALAAPDLPAHLKPTAFYVRAQAYAQAKKYDLATADFSSALSLRPTDYDTLFARGVLYGMASKYDLARADFASAIALRPELADARVAHAAAYLAEEKYDDAIRDYDAAIASAPEDGDMLLLRGDANRRARRFDAALADFGAAIDKDSRDATAYSLRAFTRLEAGDLRKAVSDYADAVDLDPNDAALREEAGVAQWEYGDYRGATRNFEKSADNPKHAASAALWLHLTALKRGKDDTDFAARTAKLDLKAWPGPLLSLYAGAGTADDAFAAAKQGDPDDQKDRLCEADFFIGEWHVSQKRDADGRALLEAAVSACPRDRPEVQAARAELGTLKP